MNHQATPSSMLQELANESRADGAILLLNIGGKVVHATVGALDFAQSLTAFAKACSEATT